MSDRAMAEQSARDMLECMEIENGFDASGIVDIAANLIADRDALAERCEKLREALNQIAVLAEWQTSGPDTSPRCKSDALSASQATSLRGSISEIARAALAAPKDARLREALTFDEFRRASVTRCLKWHPAGITSWSPSDWITAVTGELGELASLVKMRNRERDGIPGNKFSPTQKQIADEIADVLTYLDLFAATMGVDLGRAAAEKFNEVSERVGFPDRIAIAEPKESHD